MKLIEIVTDKGYLDTIEGIGEAEAIVDVWKSAEFESDRIVVKCLVHDNGSQQVLDQLQRLIGSVERSRIVMYNVETTLPQVVLPKQLKENGITREELYDNLKGGADLHRNYFILVILSTLVAAIGLVENNVAVLVGAMVIAPLLGPNLSLAFATALGDSKLITRSFGALIAGLAVAVGVSTLIGVIWEVDLHGQELFARTVYGFDSIVLALASGAAAVLSLTTGLSSTLVGVMVAVALLPPATAMGITLGSGDLGLATGAALLLAINIVCLNLAAKLVFILQGIAPRTWLEKTKAKRAMLTYLVVWALSLGILIVLIVMRE